MTKVLTASIPSLTSLARASSASAAEQSSDYRNELGAALEQIDQLKQELERVQESQMVDLRSLEEQHATLQARIQNKGLFMVQMGSTVVAGLVAIVAFFINQTADLTSSVWSVSACFHLASAMFNWVTRTERKKQVELSAGLLEQARERHRAELKVSELSRVRVAGAVPSVEDDAGSNTPIEHDQRLQHARSH